MRRLIEPRAWLALAILALGCVPGPDRPNQKTAFSGTVQFEDTTPINAQPATVTITVTGDNLFLNAEGCQRRERHAQGIQHLELAVQDAGRFAGEFDSARFISAGPEVCVSEKTRLDSFQSVLITFGIETSYENCSAFCKAHSPATQSSCLAECTGAPGRIEGTRVITKLELASLASQVSEHQIELANVSIVLNRLAPAARAKDGPDLAVNADVVAASLSFGYEDFNPQSCAIYEGCLRAAGHRRLLRFDNVLVNVGNRDLMVGPAGAGNPLFYYSACHGHFHLKEVARYELLDPQTHRVVTVGGEPVVGHQQGTCVPPSRQGTSSDLSVLTADEAECQWLDITDVSAGEYLLRIVADPNGMLDEADKSNNSGEVPVTIPAGS